MTYHETAKRIGLKVKLYRNKIGLSQEQLAEKLDISQSHMSGIERGSKLPSFPVFLLLVDIFGISADALLEGVIQAGYTIKANWLSEIISQLSVDEQERVLNVVEAMIKGKTEENSGH